QPSPARIPPSSWPAFFIAPLNPGTRAFVGSASADRLFTAQPRQVTGPLKRTLQMQIPSVKAQCVLDVKVPVTPVVLPSRFFVLMRHLQLLQRRVKPTIVFDQEIIHAAVD